MNRVSRPSSSSPSPSPILTGIFFITGSQARHYSISNPSSPSPQQKQQQHQRVPANHVKRIYGESLYNKQGSFSSSTPHQQATASARTPQTTTTTTTLEQESTSPQQESQPQNAVVIEPKLRTDPTKQNLSPDATLAEFHGLLTETPSMRALLMENALIVERSMQWAQVLVGFDQANKYTIKNNRNEVVAYIAEEDSIGKGLMRNLTHTHRSFTATILDPQGVVLAKIRRPFYFINSSMHIEDINGNVIGEIQQRFHVFRRQYDLYLGKRQFARINAPILSWDFELKDVQDQLVATVNRDFTGFARTLFTDANQYVVRLGDGVLLTDPSITRKSLTLEERAIALAAAIAVDFDYFSHTSGGPGLLAGLIPIPLPMPAPSPDVGPGDGDIGSTGPGAMPDGTEQPGTEMGESPPESNADGFPTGDDTAFPSDDQAGGSYNWNDDDFGMGSGGGGGGDDSAGSVIGLVKGIFGGGD